MVKGDTAHPQNTTIRRPVVIGRICRNVDFGRVSKKLHYNIINKYANVFVEN